MQKIILEITGSNEECSWVSHYGFLAESKEAVSIAIMEALDAILAPCNTRGLSYVPYDECPKFIKVLGTTIDSFSDMIFYGNIYKDHIRTDKMTLQYEEPRVFTLDEWFDYIRQE